MGTQHLLLLQLLMGINLGFDHVGLGFVQSVLQLLLVLLPMLLFLVMFSFTVRGWAGVGLARSWGAPGLVAGRCQEYQDYKDIKPTP